jgi:peptide/nickel transport system substrate-binding protein/oligopeptide transport system substrate-binding protein
MPLIPLYAAQGAYLHSAKIEPRNSKFTGVQPLYSTFK